MKRFLYTIVALNMTALLLCSCGASPEDETGLRQEAEIDSPEEDTADPDEELQEKTDKETDGAETPDQETIPDEETYDAFDGDHDAEKEADESPATGYMIGDHERTLDGIKEYLSTLSEEPAEFAKTGGLAVSWDSVAGMRNLVAFEERYAAGEEAEIVVMQYTVEGDPVLDYLYYDGKEIWRVLDSSRDMWTNQEYAYIEQRYPYLLNFTQKAEERDRMHSLVLSKMDGLSYDECTQAYFGGGSGEEAGSVLFITSFFFTDEDL